jgi:hypothetical protein
LFLYVVTGRARSVSALSIEFNPKVELEIYGNPQFNTLVAQEIKLLADGVKLDDKKSANAALKQALKIKRQRFKIVKKNFGKDLAQKYKRYERTKAFIEGTARYFEQLAMVMHGKYAPNSFLTKDPMFKNFTGWPNSIGYYSDNWNKYSIENPLYQLGFFYCLILDQTKPDWKKKVFKSSKYFDSFF